MKHILPVLALCALFCGPSFAAEKKQLKVFVLAGQSNMEGQAVVDLAGKDYNEGRGSLVTLMRDTAGATHDHPFAFRIWPALVPSFMPGCVFATRRSRFGLVGSPV